MRNIKSGDTGQSVKELQSLLGINISGNFDTTTEKAVRDYQKSNGLVCDGVVGYSTWKSLFTGQRGTIEGSISNNDYVIASKLLDCDIASIKVIQAVETGGSGEFAQLLLTINFIINNPRIHNALRLKDWILFAKYYNGPGQVAVYSDRLKKAYGRL